MYLAVDPGRNAGWAAFADDGYLYACGLAHPPFDTIPMWYPTLVIEKPHGGRGKSSRLDIAKLARRMQQIIDRVGAEHVIEVAPNRWKKSVRKSVMVRRIRDDWMTDAERVVLGKCRNHNVIDAIGIGIHHAQVLGLRP